MQFLLFLSLGSALSNSPISDASEPVVAPVEGSTAFELDAALENYLNGDLPGARSEIRRISRLPDFEAFERREEALIYLAEIEYYLGEREAAWETCQRLLLLTPNFRVDPFVHPPELVAFFDSVKSASLQPEPLAPVQVAPRVPGWALFLPGGIQLHRDQDVLGILAIAGVGSLSISSAALYGALRGYDLDLQRPGIQVTSIEDRQRADSLLLWTNVTRWSAVGVYGAGLLHGLLSINGMERTQRVSLSPNGILWTWEWP
ncbi:MAG: hypothetical protein VXW32_11560 [Myxococcota bacterium]|nr:hypothetical protein [Myxococcota bacterium]